MRDVKNNKLHHSGRRWGCPDCARRGAGTNIGAADGLKASRGRGRRSALPWKKPIPGSIAVKPAIAPE
jgi:hypothetical protein